MRICRQFLDNPLRNYALGIESLDQSICFDPFFANLSLELFINKKIDSIWLTHAHNDHIAGVEELVKLTGAKVYSPFGMEVDFKVDKFLKVNEVYKWQDFQIEVLDTPGHIFPHYSFLINSINQSPKLICGDTIFAGGVGNCRNGDAGILYETIQYLKRVISDDTEIFCSHDYLFRNLNFALMLNFNNDEVLKIQKKVKDSTLYQMTWREEKKYNPFIQNISREEFIKFRTLRDQY